MKTILIIAALVTMAVSGWQIAKIRRGRRETTEPQVQVRLVADVSKFVAAMNRTAQQIALRMAERPMVVDLAHPFHRRLHAAWKVLRG